MWPTVTSDTPPAAGGRPVGVVGRTVRCVRPYAVATLGWPRSLWARRWGVLRLALAVGLLSVFVGDNPARLARLGYAALPDLDHLAEARRLTAAERYDEALLVLDAGLADGGDDGRRAELEAARRAALARRDSIWRRAREAGVGALTGTGRSLESLGGALLADLIVAGDVRDLAIQGARLALDGETDEIVVVLSGLGLVTTLNPSLDVVPGFLKCAHKAGCVTRRLARGLADLCRTALRERRYERLVAVAGSLRELIRRTTPGIAARVLKACDDPKDVERVAEFAARERFAGQALLVLGEDAVALAGRAGAAGDKALLLAARKGAHGAAWLRSGAYRLLRPHPLIGVAKGVYKGNVAKGLVKLSDRWLDPGGWLVIPALAAWVVAELGLLVRRRAGRPLALAPVP